MGRKTHNTETRRQQRKKQFEDQGLSYSSQKTREKYQDTYGYKEFTLSESQKTCQDIIRNNTLTFIEGPAGVGKSLSVFHYAVQEYLKDPTMRIIVIRTPVEAGSDKIGFLPSDLSDKLEPHFSSTKLLLEQLLNPSKVQADMDGSLTKIQFLIPNYAIGATWDNAIVCIDEAQQIQPLIMKLLLERIGVNSKVIVMGDPSQVYATSRDRHGMKDAITKFFHIETEVNPETQRSFKYVGEAKYADIGYFKFNPKDCMRSDIVRTVIQAYSEKDSLEEI